MNDDAENKETMAKHWSYLQSKENPRAKPLVSLK
jgi:hypothetical protein